MRRRSRATRLDVRVYDDGSRARARPRQPTPSLAIGDAIDARGAANVMLATGNSQLDVPRRARRRVRDVDWTRVTAFHMDEYAGLSADASRPASSATCASGSRLTFRCATSTTSTAPTIPRPKPAATPTCSPRTHSISAARASARTVISRSTTRRSPTSTIREAVKVIALEAASRRQQVGEGHFATIDDVPTHAITVTIPALLAARPRARDRPRGAKGEARTGHARGADLDRVPGDDPPDPVARHALPGSRRSATPPARSTPVPQ